MGDELDLDRAPSPAPGEVEAGVDGQAMEPGVEPVRVAETGQVAPGADERLLDRVARELRVPEDEAGGRVQPREGRVDERGEGVMIAPPRSLDEPSLVHGRLGCATTTAVVFDRVWRRPSGNRSRGTERRTIATMTTDDQADAHEQHEQHDHDDHAHHEHHEHRPEPVDYTDAVEGFRADKDEFFKTRRRQPDPGRRARGLRRAPVLPGRRGAPVRGPDARAIHRRRAVELPDPDLGRPAAAGASGGRRSQFELGGDAAAPPR